MKYFESRLRRTMQYSYGSRKNTQTGSVRRTPLHTGDYSIPLSCQLAASKHESLGNSSTRPSGRRAYDSALAQFGLSEHLLPERR